jgi:hypothetical protein
MSIKIQIVALEKRALKKSQDWPPADTMTLTVPGDTQALTEMATSVICPLFMLTQMVTPATPYLLPALSYPISKAGR